MLRVRIAEVVHETPDARSLVLEPLDGSGTPDYRPGQFLTVRIPSERTGSVARCYSLSSCPHRDEPMRITVKRTDGGYGSNWLCDNAAEGGELDVLPPSGTFTPASLDEDVLLVAAGSGITPVMSIAKSCLHAGTGSVFLLYANRDQDSVIFQDELRDLVSAHPDRFVVVHWLESVQGLPSPAAVRALVRGREHGPAFVCGPEPFMAAVGTALAELGVPRERVHVEKFSSLSGDPFAEVELDRSGPASTVEVELDGEQHSVSWPQGAKLLDALLDAGLDAPYSCREGACSACACFLLEGRVELERNEVLDQQDLDDGLILACQAIPVSERLRVSYDA